MLLIVFPKVEFYVPYIISKQKSPEHFYDVQAIFIYRIFANFSAD